MKRNSRRHVADLTAQALDRSQGIRAIPASERVYQFKLTRKDNHPPIWRRFQVKDCTLDKLHEHVQTAMGWTNSHLNQPHLLADLTQHFERVLDEAETLPRSQYYHTEETNRGRREERFYYTTPVPHDLRNPEAWRDLASVGWVVSLTERDGKETCQVRGYISSLRPNAKRLAKAVRQHWGIENGQHWVLDVVFNEDQCRARAGNEPENLAILRRLALNLLNREATPMPSLRVKGRAAGWNDDLMLRILTAGTT